MQATPQGVTFREVSLSGTRSSRVSPSDCAHTLIPVMSTALRSLGHRVNSLFLGLIQPSRIRISKGAWVAQPVKPTWDSLSPSPSAPPLLTPACSRALSLSLSKKKQSMHGQPGTWRRRSHPSDPSADSPDLGWGPALRLGQSRVLMSGFAEQDFGRDAGGCHGAEGQGGQ